MEKNGKAKNIVLAVLLVAVVTLSIAYAALSATLTINGQATVKAGTSWDVHFQQKTGNDPICVASSKSGESTTAQVKTQGTLNQDGTSFSGLTVDFMKPGDKVVCTWEVTNAGSINAKLTDVTIGTPDCTSGADCTAVKSNINYTLKINNATPAVNDELPATTDNTKTVVYTVEFKDTATSLPSSDVTINGLGATLVYGQN